MNTDMKRRMQAVLRRSFGLSTLRPGQYKAIETLLDGRDLLCILPTGGGKSLCYQLPAMLHSGMVLVISPLIALMRDQVAHMQALGVPAVSLDSQQDALQRQQYLREIAAGAYRLVYVSPERLLTPAFQQALSDCPPWLIVVDEAHCLVQWGDSFRPAYQQAADWLSGLPNRPVICAMTATADAAMQRSLTERLQMQRPARVVLPIRRDNLHYQAVLCAAPLRWIARYVRQHEGQRGVIFCRSRRETETLAASLRSWGIAAQHYHAGMERSERDTAQQQFMEGQLQLLAATSAFGMGVDIPDIRYVIQTYLSDDLTAYAQQAGRAGRDGQEADCIQLIVPHDLDWYRHQLTPPRSFRQRFVTAGQRFVQMMQVRKVMTHFMQARCLSASLSRAFGQHEKACGCCSACLRRRQRVPVALCTPPALHRMTKSELAVWCGFVARAQIARERHVRPQSILPDHQLIDSFASGMFLTARPDEAALARFNDVLRSLGYAVQHPE